MICDTCNNCLKYKSLPNKVGLRREGHYCKVIEHEVRWSKDDCRFYVNSTLEPYIKI